MSDRRSHSGAAGWGPGDVGHPAGTVRRVQMPYHGLHRLWAVLLVLMVAGVPGAMPRSLARAASVVGTLALLRGGPDDLAAGPGGSLYVALVYAGAVAQVSPRGTWRVIARGLSAPEGIVVERGGALLVGEQGRNRVVRLDPRTGAISLLVRLPNTTGRDGMDGLALDPHDGSLLVPDSPNGRLLRVSPDGRHVTVLATGLGRPVGVALTARGWPVVVDETLDGAYVVHPGGTLSRLGGFLNIPDDIVADGQGGFYITCLGDGTVRHVATNGAMALVAAGLPNPQGLLRRQDGSLVVAEEDTGRLVVFTPALP